MRVMRAGRESETVWRSYHFHYHGDRRLLVRRLIRPLVARLLERHLVDRFFFLYYPLGGPHVRLRLRCAPESGAELDPLVEAAAAEFFLRFRSEESLDPAAIVELNRHILAGAPVEDDLLAYPDNSMRVAPFQPESDRYGGPALLPHSLDFFTLSSAYWLQRADADAAFPWSRHLSEVFRLLVRQAWGFAATMPEFLRLLSYRASSPTEIRQPEVQADRVFAARPETFIGLLRDELQALAARGPTEVLEADDPFLLAEGARRLSAEVRGADEATRRRIGISQVHMTANRAGVSPGEETYLSRLLANAARSLMSRKPDLWHGLERELDPARRDGAGWRLAALLPAALAGLHLPSSVPHFRDRRGRPSGLTDESSVPLAMTTASHE